MNFFEIVSQGVITTKKKRQTDFWLVTCTTYICRRKGQIKATSVLIKFLSCAQKFNCNQNSQLYEALMLCPYLPYLFLVGHLQSYQAVSWEASYFTMVHLAAIFDEISISILMHNAVSNIKILEKCNIE